MSEKAIRWPTGNEIWTFLTSSAAMVPIVQSTMLQKYIPEEVKKTLLSILEAPDFWRYTLAVLIPLVAYLVFHALKHLVLVFFRLTKRTIAIDVRTPLLKRIFGIQDFGDQKPSKQYWQDQPDRFDVYNRFHFSDGSARQYQYLRNFSGLIVREKPAKTEIFEPEFVRSPTWKDFTMLAIGSRWFPLWAATFYFKRLIHRIWKILP